MKSAPGIALAAALLVLTVPARAHHGTGTYDSTRSVTLSGVVTEFAFVNPHASLFFEVKDASGAIVNWAIVETPRRVFQFFEWAHAWRVIWTDGRELPVDPEPRWMGYSVGRWEGNEFVVSSVGFDERTWLDHFGHPISDEARFEERYRRVDGDTLELTMTLTDPKAYARPWVSEKKTFRLDPRHEIEELFCVPSENDAFNRRVRDPGAGVTR